MNIIEGNKLITEFMGFPKCRRCDYDCGHYQVGPLMWKSSEMKYHNSWDWIMRPVNKIQHLKFDVVIEIGNACHICGERGMIDFHKFLNEEPDNLISDIEALYSVILEFIKWYNESMEDNSADQQFMPPNIDMI